MWRRTIKKMNPADTFIFFIFYFILWFFSLWAFEMSFASLSTHKRPLRKQSINLHAAIKYNKKKNGEQKIIRNGLERERETNKY